MIDMPGHGRHQLAAAQLRARRPSSSTSTRTLGYGMAYLYDTSDKPEGYGGGGGGNFDSRSACSRWTSGPAQSSGGMNMAAKAVSAAE